MHAYSLTTSVATLLIISAFTISAPDYIRAQDASPEAAEDTPDDPGMEIGVLAEYIRVDHLTANRLLRENAQHAANCANLREELDTMIAEGNAELLETVWVRAPDSSRAKVESIQEEIYPTEYDPPEIPNYFGGVSPAEAKQSTDQPKADVRAPALNRSTDSTGPITSGMPTAFETRNLGTTLEVDARINENKTISVSLAPEIVEFLEMRYFTRDGYEDVAHGTQNVRMPVFYTMKTTTQFETVPGNYNLIAIHTPHADDETRIFLIVRADLIKVK